MESQQMEVVKLRIERVIYITKVLQFTLTIQPTTMKNLWPNGLITNLFQLSNLQLWTRFYWPLMQQLFTKLQRSYRHFAIIILFQLWFQVVVQGFYNL